MKYEKVFLFFVVLIVVGIWTIVFQNAGIIQPVSRHKINIGNSVDIRGTVDIGNIVDVNFAELVGERLVSSENGMLIGVKSTKNTVIPISWGEVKVK